MTGTVGTHRFGEEFVDEWRRRWVNRAVHERPLTYDIAVLDEFAERRAWYAEQIDRLPASARDAMSRKLWNERHIWSSTLELAAGAWLRSCGFEAAYEQRWDTLTPDWTALDGGGAAAAFVEVHTDEPRQGTYGRIRAWNALVQRIGTIPVPYVLTLAAPRRNVTPPDAGTARRIVADVRDALLRVNPQTMIMTHGYTFLVMADPRRRGELLRSPSGLRCHFAPPSEIAGSVTARRIAQNAAAKVGKYSALADRYELPLLVATGAHPFTGVGIDSLDDLLVGRQTITFQFNPGDTFIGEQQVVLGRPEIWRMPPELSAVVWIDNHYPFSAVVRANPAARRAADRLFSPEAQAQQRL